jgi:tetratricopeptide (TPR) repeat protein
VATAKGSNVRISLHNHWRAGHTDIIDSLQGVLLLPVLLPMNLEQCYQLFNLQPGASATQVKGAYRKLARVMHPDVNPEDASAHNRFVTLNQAYQLLLAVAEGRQPVATIQPPAKKAAAPPVATLSKQEAALKWSSYQKLQELLQQRELTKAVSLVDALASRLGQDPDVCQWQGIVYYFFGQHLLDRCQVDKAKIYLKKALKADPHNPQLWNQVHTEYHRIEQMMSQL